MRPKCYAPCESKVNVSFFLELENGRVRGVGVVWWKSGLVRLPKSTGRKAKANYDCTTGANPLFTDKLVEQGELKCPN